MSGSGITLTGHGELQRQLETLAKSGPSIARSAVRAGCAVLASACREAAPGSTKREMGFYVRTEGNTVRGRAGLMRFPKRGTRGKQPHAVFLDQGTKYIAARHFVRAALNGAKARALQAANRAARRRVRAILTNQ